MMRTKQSPKIKNYEESTSHLTSTYVLLWKSLDINSNINIASTMRPNSLNVNRERYFYQSKKFVRETLNAWRERSVKNHVPAENIQVLFQELQFYPSEEQVHEMLQTAKLFARRSNTFDVNSKQLNGLTFGEFCVLLADLKRFKTFSITKHDNHNINDNSHSSSLNNNNSKIGKNNNFNNSNINVENNSENTSSQHKALSNRSSLNNLSAKFTTPQTQPQSQRLLQLNSTTAGTTQKDTTRNNDSKPRIQTSQALSLQSSELVSTESETNDSGAPEVFLGGSCNPTTWRADVAIPALNELGISFYNPQVSDWTPDLIELEHRAKEKARVLFFVMDSETRASAGAIEAAHIAGQNTRHLVLVLHPYKPDQKILNEPVSAQEFIDLSRNQQLLRELVTRRGLPVLDSIQSGLQRTKSILAGIHPRDPPTNIATRLISVRRAFDRVVEESKETINLLQCQKALSCLGFPNTMLSIENIKKIVKSYDEALDELAYSSSSTDDRTMMPTTIRSQDSSEATCEIKSFIKFDEFCVIVAYLSVLQQEINNSACVSPIKGFNVPPPPIFFTNTPEYIHSQPSPRCCNQSNDLPQYSSLDGNAGGVGVVAPTTSAGSVSGHHNNILMDYKLNRDSGTSSPQPLNETTTTTKHNLFLIDNQGLVQNSGSSTLGSGGTSGIADIKIKCNKISVNVEIIDHQDQQQPQQDDDSDSTDSVFSSGSSSATDDLNMFEFKGANNCLRSNAIRDIYLGGSCVMRTNWRQEFAIPYLKEKGISYYLSDLHESIEPSTLRMNFGGRRTDLQSHLETAPPHSEKRIRFNGILVNHHDSSIHSDVGEHEQTKNEIDDDKRENEDQNKLNLIENTLVEYTKQDGSSRGVVGGGDSALNTFNSETQHIFNPKILDSSRVLFFLITNETRSLAPMTLAAHYIGLGYNVVLCVQMLPEVNCTIQNQQLTPSAIKDYNRGRAYLIDLAKRQGIPVFNDPQQAIDCAIEKVKISKSRHSFN